MLRVVLRLITMVIESSTTRIFIAIEIVSGFAGIDLTRKTANF
jgi:hypothetical protein